MLPDKVKVFCKILSCIFIVNVIDGFDMPVEVIIDDKNIHLFPNTEFKKTAIKNLYLNVDDDYYIFTKDLKIIVDK